MKKNPKNNGRWTEARYRSFVMSALRNARWPLKYEAKKIAFKRYGINPKTGRKIKLYECAECKLCFSDANVQIDHTQPVVPLTGFDSWDATIERLFCELDNLKCLCKECHAVKSKEETSERARIRKAKKEEKQGRLF